MSAPAFSSYFPHVHLLGVGATCLFLTGCGGNGEDPLGEADKPKNCILIGDSVRSIPIKRDVDILFVVDDSPTMASKRELLAKSVPGLLAGLVDPPCVKRDGNWNIVESQPAGSGECALGFGRAWQPATSLHVGVITSSLGGHGADVCFQTAAASAGAHLITPPKTQPGAHTTGAFGLNPNGFLEWMPAHIGLPAGSQPTGPDSLAQLIANLSSEGCAYPASLESWYRFLVDPEPPLATQPPDMIADTNSWQLAPAAFPGVDQNILAQREAFLRPNSHLLVVNLSDQDDCSLIEGQLPPHVADKEGNLQPWPDRYHYEDNRGFPANHLLLRKSVGNGQTYQTPRPTKECAQDSFGASCQSCFEVPAGQKEERGCGDSQESTVPMGLRCSNQRARFGISGLYPIQRYVDGLSSERIYDRHGKSVENGLLKRRNPERIRYLALAGVPWQDIANDPADAAQGPRRASFIDWSLVLGKPRSGTQPRDGLMVVTEDTRHGSNVLGEELGGPGTWNTINGHEWNTAGEALQFACTSDLPASVLSAFACSDYAKEQSPLCDIPVNMSMSPPFGGGTHTYSNTQYRDGATPAPRLLQVVKALSAPTPELGSICAQQTTDPSLAGYGYRPALESTRNHLATRGLRHLCLPESLPTDELGQAKVYLFQVRYPLDAAAQPSAEELAQCRLCDEPGLAPVAEGAKYYAKRAWLSHQCVCKLEQRSGQAGHACITEGSPLEPGSGEPMRGWCVIDPSTPGLSADEAELFTQHARACSSMHERGGTCS